MWGKWNFGSDQSGKFSVNWAQMLKASTPHATHPLLSILHKVEVHGICVYPWFRLWWKSAPVGQDFQPKTRLFETMVDLTDKDRRKRKKKKETTTTTNLKLEFSGGQVYCSRVWKCPNNLTFREPPCKKHCHVTTMSFLHPCLKFFPLCNLLSHDQKNKINK